MSTYYDPLFIGLQKPQKKCPWEPFAASYIVQAIAVTALLVYTVTAPRIEPAPVRSVDLVAPELNAPPRVAQVKAVRRVSRVEPARFTTPATPRIQAPVLQVQQPQRMHRVAEVAEVPQPQLAVAPKFDSKLLNALPAPKATGKIIATNTFGGSSAAPTLQKIAPSKVQTGGFGDPNGTPANAHGSNKPNIAAVGSFDLPAGSGYGNGSGGTSGARGTVASVGFGNSVAAQGGGYGASARQGRIQTTSFVNARSAPATDAARQAKATNHQAISTPVSIQSKPTPMYTSEARQLRVEGEVLVNVVFTAEGQIRIVKVVRGLGHGLDEAAQRAVQGLRFSPALRDGHPVDSNATLHIVFQLS
jgi:TonB family protein